MGMGDTGGNPNRAEITEKRVRAYDLRLRGMSYRAIAAQMTSEGVECTYQSIANWVKLESDDRLQPLADEYRTQELDRLDSWLLRLNEQIDDPENSGRIARLVEVAVKVSERKAKLLGADAPARVEATITESTPIDDAVAGLVKEIEARNAPAPVDVESGAEL